MGPFLTASSEFGLAFGYHKTRREPEAELHYEAGLRAWEHLSESEQRSLVSFVEDYVNCLHNAQQCAKAERLSVMAMRVRVRQSLHGSR